MGITTAVEALHNKQTRHDRTTLDLNIPNVLRSTIYVKRSLHSRPLWFLATSLFIRLFPGKEEHKRDVSNVGSFVVGFIKHWRVVFFHGVLKSFRWRLMVFEIVFGSVCWGFRRMFVFGCGCFAWKKKKKKKFLESSTGKGQ